MTTVTMARRASLDWLRVGAWSGSFIAHGVVLLLIAVPMTVPSMRPPVTTIVARWIEAKPPVVSEPPPQAPHPHRTTPLRTAAPPAAPVAPAGAQAPPVATADSDETPIAMDAAPSAPTSDIGSGSATQALAYATPLRPAYPPASMRAREQGSVLLRVLVDATGVPQHVEIARSSGHARLDAAARDSVMRARFRPVMRDGQATSAWGLVPIEFRLDRG